MNNYKPLLTVLALVFALLFITAFVARGNAGPSSLEKQLPKLALSMKTKKAVHCESVFVEIKNRLATLTMIVLTNYDLLN